MKLTKLLLLTLSGVFSFAGIAQATPAGYHNLGGASAFWDTFNNGAVFSGAAAQANSGFTTATAAQSTSHAAPFGPQAPTNDTFYHSFTPGMTAGLESNWQLTLQTTTEVTEFSIQFKYNIYSKNPFFTPVISVGGTDYSADLREVYAGGEANRHIQIYSWTGLSIAADTEFVINFTNGTTSSPHMTLDGFQVNTAVPEPGTWAALALGAGVLAVGRRLRRKA